MVDYTNYISFEIPQGEGFESVPDGLQKMNLQDIESMKSVINQLASTSRGRRLIEEAAAQSPDGKIHITEDPDGMTGAYPGTVTISGSDGVSQYRGVDGELHDMSI